MAPDAPISLPAPGAAGTVAGLLLAGVSGVISIMAFSSAAAVVRRREGAAAAASGVQLTLGVGAVVAGLVNGFDQQIVAGLLVTGIGLLLATASNRR